MRGAINQGPGRSFRIMRNCQVAFACSAEWKMLLQAVMVAWGEALVRHRGPDGQAGPGSASSADSAPSSSTPARAQEAAPAAGSDTGAWRQAGTGPLPAAQALLLAVHGASEALLGGGQGGLQSRFKNLEGVLI